MLAAGIFPSQLVSPLFFQTQTLIRPQRVDFRCAARENLLDSEAQGKNPQHALLIWAKNTKLWIRETLQAHRVVTPFSDRRVFTVFQAMANSHSHLFSHRDRPFVSPTGLALQALEPNTMRFPYTQSLLSRSCPTHCIMRSRSAELGQWQ